MTGADRQWQLNRRNFEGRWCGESRWYLRQDGGEGALDLTAPSRVIADTCYAIRFFDADRGEWDGSGLLFAPDGRRLLPLSRQTYNRGGQCWQFEAAGGQSSLQLDRGEPRWGHEINLFSGRSRSMLVLLWGRREGGVSGASENSRAGVADGEACRWRLDAVGAVPFRCSLAEHPDPPRPTPAGAGTLLEPMRGWRGWLETLVPGDWPADPPPPQPCEPFAPEAFALHPLTAAFADGLVCSVPEWLPAGAFQLQVGCSTAPDAFQQLSLHFEANGELSRWERRRFRAGA